MYTTILWSDQYMIWNHMLIFNLKPCNQMNFIILIFNQKCGMFCIAVTMSVICGMCQQMSGYCEWAKMMFSHLNKNWNYCMIRFYQLLRVPFRLNLIRGCCVWNSNPLAVDHESTSNMACLIFVEFYPRAKSSATYEIAEGILQTPGNVQNAFRLQFIYYFCYSEATMLVTGKRFPCQWAFVRESIIFLDFPHKGSCGAMVFRWYYSTVTEIQNNRQRKFSE